MDDLTKLKNALVEIHRLREVVAWYGECARLARLITSEGDAGRNALADDGGKKAARVLADFTSTQTGH